MILVTGASGFLGGELVKQLVANGNAVRILKRNNSDISHLNSVIDKIEVTEGDILDITSLEDACKNIKQIYHCAAVVSYDNKSNQQMYKTNIEGTANVVNIALSAGVKKILHVSSIAAIGGKPNVLIDESCKWEENEWTTNYGITKQMAERQIYRGIEEGLEATIINPGIIVGIGNNDQKSTIKILDRISKQKMPFYSEGSNGFVAIEDVVNLCIILMNGQFNGERFIAISENWTFKKYFETIAKAFGVEPPKRKLNQFNSRLFYMGDAFLSFILPNRKRSYTKENSKVGLEQFSYSNQKIKSALNYEFIPMETTIQKIVNDFRNGNR